MFSRFYIFLKSLMMSEGGMDMPRKSKPPQKTDTTPKIKQADVAALIMDSMSIYRSELLSNLASNGNSFDDEQKKLLSSVSEKTLSVVRGRALERVTKLYK